MPAVDDQLIGSQGIRHMLRVLVTLPCLILAACLDETAQGQYGDNSNKDTSRDLKCELHCGGKSDSLICEYNFVDLSRSIVSSSSFILLKPPGVHNKISNPRTPRWFILAASSTVCAANGAR